MTSPFVSLKKIFQNAKRTFEREGDAMRIPLYWALSVIVCFMLLSIAMIYNTYLSFSVLENPVFEHPSLEESAVNRVEVHALVEHIERRARMLDALRTAELPVRDPMK